MALIGSLTTGASGVNTNSRTMTVVGNNIANVNTYGFKGSRVFFEDILGTDFPQGTGKTKITQGVQIGSVRSDFSQGAFESTDLETDMAIAGNGFFTLKDEYGKEFYSRAGQFTFDKDGYLTTDRGLQVQALAVDPITQETKGFPGGLKIMGTIDAPLPTGDGTDGTGIKLQANLDAGAKILEIPFDPTNVQDNMYNFASTVTVYDKIGEEHTATIAFRRRPDAAGAVDPATGQPVPGSEVKNQWEWYVLFDGGDIGQTPGQQQAVGGGFLQFSDDGRMLAVTGGRFEAQPGGIDPATGQQLPGGPPILVPEPVDPNTGLPQIVVPMGGDLPQVIGVNLGAGSNPDDPTDQRTGLDGITQFAAPSDVIEVGADGHPSGALEDIYVESTGMINGVFDSGYTRPLGKVILTRFDNPGKLIKRGENLLMKSNAAGKSITGEAGRNGLGEIRSRTLEQSNVDLAREFVKMIETQRAFSANAKTVSTSDEMLQELITMKR